MFMFLFSFCKKKGGISVGDRCLGVVFGYWRWAVDFCKWFFFFWVIGDRCGVWVIGFWYLMVFFFFFFWELMVDYRLLLVMVVSGVYSAMMVGGGGHVVMVFSVKFVVVEQKE